MLFQGVPQATMLNGQKLFADNRIVGSFANLTESAAWSSPEVAPSPTQCPSLKTIQATRGTLTDGSIGDYGDCVLSPVCARACVCVYSREFCHRVCRDMLLCWL